MCGPVGTSAATRTGDTTEAKGVDASAAVIVAVVVAAVIASFVAVAVAVAVAVVVVVVAAVFSFESEGAAVFSRAGDTGGALAVEAEALDFVGLTYLPSNNTSRW